MGRVVNNADYTFSKAAKTITFSGAYTGLELPQIQLITDVTNNTIIYQFNKPALGGTLVGLVLTLTYNTNTGAFNDTDDLMIIVDIGEPLTDAELRASPVPISGTVTANTGLTQPLTDTQLRATPVPVSGPLTDTQLRATPVPISGTVTANTGLTQPLTDTQLRATPVPVSGPLTDTQLRATPVPVSGTVTTTPSGTQDENLKQVNGATVDVGTGASSTGTQRVAVASDSTIATVGQNSDVRQSVAANLNATVVQGTATNLKTQAENYQGGTAVGAGNPLQVSLANTGANATPVAVSAASLPLPTNAAIESGGNLAALVTAMATLTAAINSSSQQKVSLDDMAMLLRRAIQAIERPPHMNPSGSLKVDLQFQNLSTQTGGTMVTQTLGGSVISTFGANQTDMSFMPHFAGRDIANNFYSKILN